MAKAQIQFNCGCGYLTSKIEDAIKHADEKHHTLTVLGTVSPDKRTI